MGQFVVNEFWTPIAFLFDVGAFACVLVHHHCEGPYQMSEGQVMENKTSTDL